MSKNWLLDGSSDDCDFHWWAGETLNHLTYLSLWHVTWIIYYADLQDEKDICTMLFCALSHYNPSEFSSNSIHVCCTCNLRYGCTRESLMKLNCCSAMITCICDLFSTTTCLSGYDNLGLGTMTCRSGYDNLDLATMTCLSGYDNLGLAMMTCLSGYDNLGLAMMTCLSG